MNHYLYPVLLGLSLLIACGLNISEEDAIQLLDTPTVSFTFDDGSTKDLAGYPFETWNAMILDALDSADLKATFFVMGYNKLDEKGQFLLKEWDRRGHQIANHTYTHPNFNNARNDANVFKDELLRTDSLIRDYDNFVPYFRFPYLKEGKTREKIDSIRAVLKAAGYTNGYVTIDASDWYINSRLLKCIRSAEPVDTAAFEAFYVQHILDRAQFYESLAYELTGRHIKHTVLLHHNLTSALFLDDLIEGFQDAGWAVIDAADAFRDPIFKNSPMTVPAGESLIWSMAKGTGNYESVLRYPAEDSRYEQPAMDSLGL
ncbi:MAG: polysaccharide deacetylase family protein [Bacteroidota bacterium]